MQSNHNDTDIDIWGMGKTMKKHVKNKKILYEI